MGDSKELIDYIEKIKKVISKVKQIELFFKEINNEEQNGGGDNKLKIEKYKKEIFKLRDKKNKYLIELEMYKEKIKELSFQNQLFNQKISQLSFANYINSTEKNNLIDKLDFFNKSLDILQGSILTNVNAGNELLEKFNTKTNMNQENKVSNVSITLKAEDLYKKDGIEMTLDGGQNDQYLPIIDQIETINNQLVPINNQLVPITNQQVGGEIGKFQRVNKISQISTELKNKIALMSTITQGVKTIIENIVRVVNDQGNQNSLLNIRIKFEWLINRFKEVYEENEETKKLLEVLEQVRNGLGENISNIGVFENILKKIETDTQGFVSGVEHISKNLPEKNIIEDAIITRAADNNPVTLQKGGANINKLLYLIESSGTDINKLINFLQYGGNDDYKKLTNYNEITKWLSFFANIKKWNDKFQYTFNIIRTNFYMILETLDFFIKTYRNIPENQNPYNDFCSILEDTLLILDWKEKDFSEFFKEDFITFSSTDNKRILNKEINEETELDFFKFMIGILVNNNNNTPDDINLNNNLQKIININNNLNELLYSFMFIKNLRYAFEQQDIEAGKVVECQEFKGELKKLLYQTELYKNQADYLKVKVELIKRIYQKLYWDPLEVFLKIYDNLEEKLQKEITVIENNFKLFILGMNYSSNQSQDHATFFKINLRKDVEGVFIGTINYEETFKYIVMLKAALYKPQNEDFLSILLTGESDEKITKDEIIKKAGYTEDQIPKIKVITQNGGNNLQYGGGMTNPDLVIAFNYLINKINELIPQNITNKDIFEAIKGLNNTETYESYKPKFDEKIDEFSSFISTVITEINQNKTNTTSKLEKYLNFLLQLFVFIKQDEKGISDSNSALNKIAEDEKNEIIANLNKIDKTNADDFIINITKKIDEQNDAFLKLLLNIYKQQFEDKKEEIEQNEKQSIVPVATAVSEVSPRAAQESLQSSENDYMLLSKTKIINNNRSKISDINDMLDKFIDGLKYDSFDKIKLNLKTYTSEIENRKLNGPFANFTITPDTINTKIDSIIDSKTLEVEKAFIKLIFENIDSNNRNILLSSYIEIIKKKLLEKNDDMSRLQNRLDTLKQQKNELKQTINILSSEIKTAKTPADKNSNIEKRNPEIIKFIKMINDIKVESRNNIKFLNKKALLLNFIEFMENQKELYADNAIEDELKGKIIVLLQVLPSINVEPKGTIENFNDGKKSLKEEIRKLINTGESDPNFIKKFNIIKKLNTQLIYTVDKIISESLNSITVFVKARKEGDTESDRYSYDKTCVTVTNKKGIKNKFGQFKNIFWSDKTISDLYCGKDINCDDKVPLTNSVRDVIEKKSISNSFITYGASGSGKTTLLFGRGDSLIEGDKKGIITRIIEDILGGSEISESGEELEIECMIGEIYGEKMNLSLLDNRFIECLYIWNLNAENPNEKMYIQDFTNESTDEEYNDFNKKLKFLQEIKSSQYITNERIFDISVLDKAKIWRSTRDMKNKFANDELYKYLNLNGYQKSEQSTYDIKYRVVGSSQEDNRPLYNIITDSDSYRKWKSEKVYNIKDITNYGKKLSEELENIINKIQVQRRIKNRVRCTKYNPDSSRSHMFIVVRLVDKITGKFRYYNFIDKAGSEIPYEIAADEFVRLAEDPNDDNINFFTIKYNVDKYSISDEGNPDKNKKNLLSKLSNTPLNDIQKFSKGSFVNESTMTYNDNEDPKIILSFSENYKIEITTRIVNVSDTNTNEIKIEGQGTKIDIVIKALEISFVIKIIDSGVPREFNPIIISWDIKQPLDMKLSYLLKLLENQILNDKDKLLIKNIILNVKKCKIKKNMQQVLFSGKNSVSTSDIQDQIIKVNKNISTLTDHLINIIEYLGITKLTELDVSIIPLSTKLKAFEKIEDSDKAKFNFNEKKITLKIETKISDPYIFLDYDLNDLIILVDIPEIVIPLDDGTKFNTTDKVFKINKYRCSKIDLLSEDIKENINLLYSDLDLLLTTEDGRKHSNKINNLKKDINELNKNIQAPLTVTNNDFNQIIRIIKPEGYDYILNYIEQGILLIRRLYIFIDLNNKIIEHKKETNPIKVKAFTNLPKGDANEYIDIDAGIKEINKYKTDYEKDFFKTLFEQVIEKSYTSTVDTTLPDTETLGIDYKNILAAYYIQRGYFSNLKQGAIGCNSPAIIEASNLIVETIKFLFDDARKNIIIRSILDTKFQGKNDNFPSPSDNNEIVTINKNDIFALEPTIKENITSWINSAEGNKPETLAKLTPFLLALQFDVSHFKGIKNLLFKNYSDEISSNNFSFYFELEESSKSDKQNIIKSLTNLIKRLYLISKLNEIFRFLDLISFNKTGNEEGNKKILDIYSPFSLMSYFDDILWSENDKITYMIEFEKIFNFKILFDLYGKQEDSIKYIELRDSKKVWIETKDEIKGENYGSLWKSVANKIVPMYLLNVRQGFWINHSIRYLMRTIMYTSDDIWIGNSLFDVDAKTIDASKTELEKLGKNETVELLVSNIQLLENFIVKNNNREVLTAEIFSNEKTLEDVYLAKYDIGKSPWLKLLGTLHHLGSNIHPTDIVIKKPESKTKTTETITKSNKTWDMKDTFVQFFMKLNKNYIKGDDETAKNNNCKEFVEALYQNQELPNIFSFTDKTYTEIFSKNIRLLEPSTPETIKKLRLPWLQKSLNEVKEVGQVTKGFMDTSEFTDLFKYFVYEGDKQGKEVTMKNIVELNKKIDDHNNLLGIDKETKEPKLIKDQKSIEDEINAYKEDVKNFQENVTKAKFDEIPSRFKVLNKDLKIVATGGGKKYYQDKHNLVYQYGGDFSDTEKEEINKLTAKTTAEEKFIPGYKSVHLELLTKLNTILNDTDIDYIKKIDFLVDKLKNRGTTPSILDNIKADITLFYKKLTEKVDEFRSNLEKSTKIINDATEATKLVDIKKEIELFNERKTIKNCYTQFQEMLWSLITAIKLKDKKFTGPTQMKPIKDITDEVTKSIYEKIFSINLIEIGKNLNKYDKEINELIGEIPEEGSDIKEKKEKYEVYISKIKDKYKSLIPKIEEDITKLNNIYEKYGDNGISKSENTKKTNIVKIKASLMIINLYKFYITKLSLTPIEITDFDDMSIKKIGEIVSEIKDIVSKNINVEVNKIKDDLDPDDSSISANIKEIELNTSAILTAIVNKEKEMNKQKTDFKAANEDKIRDLNAELDKELKVKNLLDLSYKDILFYHGLYAPFVKFQEAAFQPGSVLKNTTLIDSPTNETTLQNLSITEKSNVKTAVNTIIEKINEYIIINGTFPDEILEKDEFNKLIQDIALNINVFNKLKIEQINILEKAGYDITNSIIEKFKTNVYTDGITGYRDLVNKLKQTNDKIAAEEATLAQIFKTFNTSIKNVSSSQGFTVPKITNNITYFIKSGPKISDEIQQSIDEQLNKLSITTLKNNKISYENKIKIYTENFKAKSAASFKFDALKEADLVKIDQLDDSIKMLSNIYYMEKFKITPTESYKENDENRTDEVIGIIKKIFKGLKEKIVRGEVLEDPLAKQREAATKSGSPIIIDASIDIEKLKLSKQVKSSEVSSDSVFSISSSRSLLLALSTRPDKVELVTNTLFFAMLLSKITNPSCEMEEESEVKQQGGNINKRYNIIRNYLNKYSDENLMNMSTNKKYKLLNTMTGGSKTLKKIIYLDEEKEINKESYKNYKIIKTNK
jgi:hypothetical protein